ncbi:hypothetical protein Agub_g7133, partial [Astrephomene gubernaculifera]
GRDGREAFCYMFLDDQDYQRFRSLSFSHCCERSAVEAFLRRVFAPAPLLGSNTGAGDDGGCNEGEGGSSSSGSSYGVLQLSTTASELDLHPEVMETILSYLQQDESEQSHHVQQQQQPQQQPQQQHQQQTLGGGGGAAAGGYISVLPSCASRVHVYFHRAPPAALAAKWPVIAAMLRCKPPPKVHRGCYKVDMATLVAASASCS